MIGLVLVTHGHLAEEMLRTLEGVLGPISKIAAVSVPDDPDRFRAEIDAAFHAVDDGQGVLVLTDMVGDTATNLSLALARESSVEIIAGVNMPMVIKAATARGDMALDELAAFIRDYGKSHILWANERGRSSSGVRR
jgi:mannose PTS system EIIA component